jgi:uncharacterized protein YeeX (DUF496 family)
MDRLKATVARRVNNEEQALRDLKDRPLSLNFLAFQYLKKIFNIEKLIEEVFPNAFI